MKTQVVKSSFLKALKKQRYEGELIHHSDRGLQYCSEEYQSLHRKYHVTCSMTDRYDCYQNALAERGNGILKMENLLTKPNDLNETKKMVAESVKLYNEQRPHTALTKSVNLYQDGSQSTLDFSRNRWRPFLRYLAIQLAQPVIV